MKAFEGILICTDLDGTLLRGDGSVSPQNKQAIEYFKSQGGMFTFITGRPPCIVSNIYKQVTPNAPIGCFNGGALYDYAKGQYLWREELPVRAMELVAYADRTFDGIGIQINTFDGILFSRENEAMKHFRTKTGVENVVCPYDAVNVPVGKIVFGDLDVEKLERLAQALRAHPLAVGFDFVRSEEILFEILPKGISKGVLLPRMAAALGVEMCKTIGVGDYDNDIELVRRAGVGVAVANARDSLKAVADYITVSNEEHAIAQIISDIERGALRI